MSDSATEKVIYLKYNGCCVRNFDRVLAKLLEVFFEDSEVLDYDSRVGWATFRIDAKTRVDPTEHCKHLDGVWWEVSTEAEIKALIQAAKQLPFFCDGCIEDRRRLLNGQLPLPRPRKS